MRSTLPRRGLLLGAAGLLARCATPPRPISLVPPVRDGAFLMSDGVRLPFRAWLPGVPTRAVVLALHGFGDSRDAWEWPAPVFAASGVALYGPDQRGFGQTPSRGRWPGAERLTEDATAMLRQLRTLYPEQKLFVLGESMGGAVAMRMAARVRPAEAAGYILVAPAVWGRAGMNFLLRGGLWLLSHGMPGVTVMDGGPVRVRASDSNAALRRLSRDPLTLHGARFDTLRGLVDLMDDALEAAAFMPAPTLAMYGGRDEVIPPEATAAMWRRLPPVGVRRAYYPNAYHLMLRDWRAAVPIGDILGWMSDPNVALPAEAAGTAWLARQG